MGFYVVFEGTMGGVFDSSIQCVKALEGLIGKKIECYETYDAAVAAWESYCQLHGYGGDYFQAGILQPERLIHNNEKRICSNQATTEMLDPSFVVQNHASEGPSNTQSSDWIIKYNMEKQLEIMCSYLSIQSAVYTRDYLRVRNGIPYFRYKVSLASSGVHEEPFKCYGRFSRCEDDAKEDAAYVAMRWLLNLTGQKVRDFNYYKARELEQKLHFVESLNIQLSNANRLLNEELDRLKGERRVHN